MTEMIELNIGAETKRSRFAPKPVKIDWNGLTDKVQRFVIEYGLRQYLADGMAGKETEALAHENVERKLAKLVSGDLSRAKGEGTSKPDTLESRARKLAGAWFREMLKAEGVKADKTAIAEAITELVKDDPKWTKEAKKQLDAETAMKAEPPVANEKLAAILARFKKAGWYVMSGGTSRERAFDSNATGFADEATAQAEADRRNAAEREAGRDEEAVIWFPMNGAEMAEAMAK